MTAGVWRSSRIVCTESLDPPSRDMRQPAHLRLASSELLADQGDGSNWRAAGVARTGRSESSRGEAIPQTPPFTGRGLGCRSPAPIIV